MSNSLPAEVLDVFDCSCGTVLVLTVGNSFRRDDGVGPYIAERLPAGFPLQVIDAGITPENVIDEVIALAPQKIIVVDAADFGGCAGTVKIISEESIPRVTLSTHMLPLNVIMPIIRDSIHAEVFYVGIQPESVELGEGLSPAVRRAADALIRRLTKKEKIKRKK